MSDDHPTSYSGGLSGLQLPIPKYQFPAPYQDVSRLTYYATLFNSIEINSSFYKVPLAATIRKWHDQVPEQFNFTFKLWKQITHCNGMNFEKNDVAQFLNAISNIGDKGGCLLIQFPPGLGIEARFQLEKLLNTIKELDTDSLWKIAVEFRNKSWYEDVIYELLDGHKAAMVTHDMPKSVTPMIELEADLVYVRFHGPTGNYRGSYSEEILSEHAGYIMDWIEEEKQVYVYFNNTAGDAFQNLTTLNKFLCV